MFKFKLYSNFTGQNRFLINFSKIVFVLIVIIENEYSLYWRPLNLSYEGFMKDRFPTNAEGSKGGKPQNIYIDKGLGN